MFFLYGNRLYIEILYSKTYLFEIKKLSLMHEIISTLHHQLKIKHKLYNILIYIFHISHIY